MPERILDRNVGGNTTYARSLAIGLQARGVQIERLACGSKPAITLLKETMAGLQKHGPSTVLHYVADTGPVVSTRTPSVVTVHGVASRWISTARKPWQEKIWRSRVALAIRSTDRLVTVSESSADDLAAVFDVDRSSISVIPHGIDIAAFSRPKQVTDHIAARLPEQFALYVGNIEPRKNLVQLVRAFDRLNLGGVGIPLVIAGRPAWNFDESMRVIENSPNVIYLGFVSDEDRVALMQRCAVFAFPSLYEGFGFPVLEAMAAGASVLTTQRGSLKEVAGPACVLNEVDEVGIAEGVLKVLESKVSREETRRVGREWVSGFSWDNSVQKHLKVYAELTAR